MSLADLVDDAISSDAERAHAKAVFGHVRAEIIAAQIDEHLSFAERIPRTALGFDFGKSASGFKCARALFVLDEGTHAVVQVHDAAADAAHLHACYSAQVQFAAEGVRLRAAAWSEVPRILGPVRDDMGRIMVTHAGPAHAQETLERSVLIDALACDLHGFSRALSSRTLPFGIARLPRADVPEGLSELDDVLQRTPEGAFVLGHTAFHRANVAVDAEKKHARLIDGFDALYYLEECALVAKSACAFGDEDEVLSTPEDSELERFVKGYERARGRDFEGSERERLDAFMILEKHRRGHVTQT